MSENFCLTYSQIIKTIENLTINKITIHNNFFFLFDSYILNFIQSKTFVQI